VAKRGDLVLFISLEMKELPLWQRLVAVESGMDLKAVRQFRKQSQDDQVRHVTADGHLSGYNFVLADDFGTSLVDIRSKTQALRSERGRLSLVVVDYLGLINHKASSRGDANRTQDVSEISRGLKQLAGELNCPVLALAQLNREVEHRSDGIPKLADLRDSGSLEQDADIVIFLDSEEVRKPETQLKGVTDLYVAKHRQGALGKIPMLFNRSNQRWSDLTYRTPEGY
jgi:replicative DNA helicase